MTSGRLAGFLASVGRTDLTPDPKAPGSADERLDAWLGRLPVSKAAKPELEVHPRTLSIRASGSGGSTFARVRITNTGYRLLRSTARIEPPGNGWLALAKEFDGRPIVTIEGTDVELEAQLPEAGKGPYRATLVVDSNGGEARVSVSLEPPGKAEAIPQAFASPTVGPVLEPPGGDRPAVRRMARLLAWPLVAVLLRLVVGVSAGVAALFGIGTAGGKLGLAGPAIAFAGMGAILGAILAARRRELGDLPVAAFAGAGGGLFVAALLFAAIGSIESPSSLVGGWPVALKVASFIEGLPVAAKVALWALIGALAALASLALAPPAEKTKKGAA